MTVLDGFNQCQRAVFEPDIRIDIIHGNARINHNCLFLAPTGTGVRDWLVNFLALPVFGIYHAGYYATAYAFLQVIPDYFFRDRPIHIYGYSQGGAVAQILCRMLRRRGYTVETVTTYGCPRGLHPLLALWETVRHKTRYINYINRGDWVASFPWWMGRAGRVVRLGRWQPVWVSHAPAAYRSHLQEL
jgi:hypothetical protein